MWGRFMAFQGRRHSSIFFLEEKFQNAAAGGKKTKSLWQEGTKEFFGKKSSISGSHISRV
jgi:hypothetical protein